MLYNQQRYPGPSKYLLKRRHVLDYHIVQALAGISLLHPFPIFAFHGNILKRLWFPSILPSNICVTFSSSSTICAPPFQAVAQSTTQLHLYDLPLQERKSMSYKINTKFHLTVPQSRTSSSSYWFILLTSTHDWSDQDPQRINPSRVSWPSTNYHPQNQSPPSSLAA